LFLYDISLPTMERLDPKTAVRQWPGPQNSFILFADFSQMFDSCQREEHYYYGIYESV
jgi:hypothetical protein